MRALQPGVMSHWCSHASTEGTSFTTGNSETKPLFKQFVFCRTSYGGDDVDVGLGEGGAGAAEGIEDEEGGGGWDVGLGEDGAGATEGTEDGEVLGERVGLLLGAPLGGLLGR